MFKRMANNQIKKSLAAHLRKKCDAFFLNFLERIKKSVQVLTEIFNSIDLPNKRRFASLFPDVYIYEEKVFGMTKSFVVYFGWNE